MVKLLAIVLLILSIPIAVYLATHPTFFKSKAAQNGSVRIYDPKGETVSNSSTIYRFIYLEIQKPDWQYGFNFHLINTALAQVDTNLPPQTTPDSLSVYPNPIIPNHDFTVNFNSSNPTATDWFGLYRIGDADDKYFTYAYTSSCTSQPGPAARGSGYCIFKAGASTGDFEYRLFRANSYEKLYTLRFTVGEDTTSPPDPDQTTEKIRISLNPNAIRPDGVCDDSKTDTDYCREITATEPDLLKVVSWVLPKEYKDYTIYVGFFGNKSGFRSSSTVVSYQQPQTERSRENLASISPLVWIGAQSFIQSAAEVTRKIPGTAAFNAVIELVERVHTAGEQIITINQAKQLGLPVEIVYNPHTGLPELSQGQGFKEMGLSVDYFPDPDPYTHEERIILLPAPMPALETEIKEVAIDTLFGETIGRAITKIGGAALNRFRTNHPAELDPHAVLDVAPQGFDPNEPLAHLPLETRIILGDNVEYSIKELTLKQLISLSAHNEKYEELAAKLNAKYVGEGYFSWTFKAEDGSLMKIWKYGSTEKEIAQMNFYKERAAQTNGELPRYLGEVYDESGNLIGWKQEFISDAIPAEEFFNRGGIFTRDEYAAAISSLRYLQDATGFTHGDVHIGNLLIQTAEVNGKPFHKLRFVDYAGYNRGGPIGTDLSKHFDLDSLRTIMERHTILD